MKILCGLGNPGREHEADRHNVGFRVIDLLAQRLRISLDQKKFDGLLGQGNLGSERVLLLQPQTYMNASGRSLGAAAHFFKVPVDSILVIHDELDLPFGRLQLKRGGGAGGHNGLRSIFECLGDDAFARVRLGVGKPAGPGAKERVVGHVLSGFSRDEEDTLNELLVQAAEASEIWVREGLSVAMNRFNRKASPKPPPPEEPSA
jgi:PTH1 family peptidyl-tRNA hydrolase